ncbi:MAG: DUF4974 domain-containing protein [Runella slithyformis]|nr:MAG: DUF4974 domain-containing protein [Runella slithyformis]TAF30031.1 MAG: DUF4974 domain-containing protein [Runella slithyformis]TAF49147.1 MAG: DUF4974 domain-containing protein [Runella slithyformis]TAF82650.1 MAG: DUF4974 domain-containing protein [Runella slithyformis]
MEYNNYTVEDLVADESFQAWVAQSNPTSVAFWQEWTHAHPEKAATVQEAVAWLRALQLRERTIPDFQLQRAEKRLLAAIENNYTIERPLHKRHWTRWVAAACTLVAIAVGANYWWQNSTVTYETGFGETRSLALPDGSLVVLNAHSTMKMARNWNLNQPRELWLDGEAFFNVKHTLQHTPFTVHTQDADIEVLGTTFNVLQRHNKTQVVLTTGKVRLTRPREKTTVVMQPGELVELRANEPNVIQQKVNIERYVSWKNNHFVFDNTPLADIIEMIESNYGYDVEVADADLLSLKLTYRLENNDLELLLTALSEALELKIEKDNNRLIVSQK